MMEYQLGKQEKQDRKIFFLLSAALIFPAIAYNVCFMGIPSYFEGISRTYWIKNHGSVFLNSLSLGAVFLILIRCSFSRILVVLSHCAVAFVLLATLIFFNYYDCIPSIYQIFMIQNIPRISDQIIFQLIGLREIIIFFSLFSSFVICMLLVKPLKQYFAMPGGRKLLIWLLILMFIIVSKNIYYAYKWRKDFSDRDSVQILKQEGFWVLYLKQFYKAVFLSPKEIEWPGKINPQRQESFQKMNSKKNIIIIQVESLDAAVVDLELNGIPVMPNLKKLSKESMYFSRFVSHHRGGGSSDAELSSLMSLIPLQSHSGFYKLKHHKIDSLAKILKNKGYTCVGMHPNSGKFFNRKFNFLKSGFDFFYDENDFSGNAVGWYSKDNDFFLQALEKMEDIESPFFLYLITMQSHGPFTNYSEDKSSVFGIERETNIVRDYMNVMSEVDSGLGAFIGRLEESGLLNETIVFIFGDHGSLVKYSHLVQKTADLFSHKEHIPLFVLGAGVAPSRNIRVGSTIDIAPTIAHLLGVEEGRGWLGTSLFSVGSGMALLNYTPPQLIFSDGKIINLEGDKLKKYMKFIKYSEYITG